MEQWSLFPVFLRSVFKLRSSILSMHDEEYLAVGSMSHLAIGKSEDFFSGFLHVTYFDHDNDFQTIAKIEGGWYYVVTLCLPAPCNYSSLLHSCLPSARVVLIPLVTVPRLMPHLHLKLHALATAASLSVSFK